MCVPPGTSKPSTTSRTIAPADILERIIRYEAVHTIQGWDDLRRRLQPPDRRCYAFFHPALPEEPLIFMPTRPLTGPPDVQLLLSDVVRAYVADTRLPGPPNPVPEPTVTYLCERGDVITQTASNPNRTCPFDGTELLP